MALLPSHASKVEGGTESQRAAAKSSAGGEIDAGMNVRKEQNAAEVKSGTRKEKQEQNLRTDQENKERTSERQESEEVGVKLGKKTESWKEKVRYKF